MYLHWVSGIQYRKRQKSKGFCPRISWIWANKLSKEETRKCHQATVETRKGVNLLEKEVSSSLCGTKNYAQGPCAIGLVVLRVSKCRGIQLHCATIVD